MFSCSLCYASDDNITCDDLSQDSDKLVKNDYNNNNDKIVIKNDKYKSNKSSSYHDSKIKIENSKISYSNNIVLKATVVDKNLNQYAKTGNVTFKINDKILGYSNVKNGKVSLNINNKYNVGVYNISAIFSCNDYLKSSKSNIGSLSILKDNSKISVEKVSCIYSKNALLKATVIDKTTNRYITNGKVAFKINNKTVGYSNISNGKVSYLYNTNLLKAGIYKINVVYGGTNSIASSASENMLNISRMKTRLLVSNITGRTNSSVLLKVNVKDSDNKNVNSGYVTFKVNSKSIGKVQVINGVAKIAYVTPNIVKNHSVSCVYESNDRYSSCSGSGKLIVLLKINILKWSSKGNIKNNKVLYNNLTKSSITNELVNACLSGTPYVCLGDGEGKVVVIVAGIHGNELSSQSAAVKLINDLCTREIHGSVYIFPFVAPSYTGNNTRTLGGVNLNSVANKTGTISNKVYQFASSHNAVGLGDFHCTMPGGKPGANAVFGTYSPLQSSATLAKYIASKTSSKYIIYNKAGSEYPGALEDYCNLKGITSVTCEVKTAHGTIASGTVEKSYSMMKSYLTYYNLI